MKYRGCAKFVLIFTGIGLFLIANPARAWEQDASFPVTSSVFSQISNLTQVVAVLTDVQQLNIPTAFVASPTPSAIPKAVSGKSLPNTVPSGQPLTAPANQSTISAEEQTSKFAASTNQTGEKSPQTSAATISSTFENTLGYKNFQLMTDTLPKTFGVTPPDVTSNAITPVKPSVINSAPKKQESEKKIDREPPPPPPAAASMNNLYSDAGLSAGLTGEKSGLEKEFDALKNIKNKIDEDKKREEDEKKLKEVADTLNNSLLKNPFTVTQENYGVLAEQISKHRDQLIEIAEKDGTLRGRSQKLCDVFCPSDEEVARAQRVKQFIDSQGKYYLPHRQSHDFDPDETHGPH